MRRYYSENGLPGRVNISLPVGTYKPSFEFVAEPVNHIVNASAEISEIEEYTRVKTDYLRINRHGIIVILTALLISIGISLYFIRDNGHPEGETLRFIFLERTEPLDQSQALREMALLSFNALASRLQTLPNLVIIDGVRQNLTATERERASKEYRLRTFVRSTTDGVRLDWQFEDELTSQIIRTGEVAITDDLAPDHLPLIKGAQSIVDQLSLSSFILPAQNMRNPNGPTIPVSASSTPLQ